MLFIRHILTHWGRVTHICVGDLTIIGSDNGLTPGQHQSTIWTNAGILLIRTLGNLKRNSYTPIKENAFENVVWKMAAILSRPQCVNWINSMYEGISIVNEVLLGWYQHIEAETKWPPFRRRCLQMHFLECKCMNFAKDFTEVCSYGSN